MLTYHSLALPHFSLNNIKFIKIKMKSPNVFRFSENNNSEICICCMHITRHIIIPNNDLFLTTLAHNSVLWFIAPN